MYASECSNGLLLACWQLVAHSRDWPLVIVGQQLFIMCRDLSTMEAAVNRSRPAIIICHSLPTNW
jgi:hypothetical protein